MPCHPVFRPLPGHCLPALLLLLALPLAPGPAPAAPPAAPPAGAWAGYELLEVTYVLRAPDGSLVRVTRHPPGAASARYPGPARGMAPSGAASAGPAPAVQPVLGLQGWLSGWLFRTPRLYEELSDYVRESWAVILRLLDYLGVVVLVAGSWVIWFLVRPVLLGLSDRTVFLLVFALVSALWAYTTQLYTSVAYALGLMLLPALVLGVLAWLARRAWAALRGTA